MEKIRIFDHPWHISHQYEQLKFPFAQFDWLFNHRRESSNKARGDIDKMFNWVEHYTPGKYDVAILHLDQQCIEEGIWQAGKGSMYRNLNEVIKDIPKIVIMHGTPYYPEMELTPSQIVEKVKNIIGDNYMVVNSHRAAEQWGFGKPIIHGIDSAEWWDLPKEPRVVTMISPGGLPAYYDRTFLDYVREGLAERDIIHCHITVDYEAKSWDEYRDFLGRSLVYFNPTKESPMPRARTEAMLSGCCVVSTPSQDADTFINEGINGFLVPRNPEYTVDLIENLLNNYPRAIAIGQEGKKTAIELFDWNRYAKEWEEFLHFVINDFREKKKIKI